MHLFHKQVIKSYLNRVSSIKMTQINFLKKKSWEFILKFY